MSFKLNYKAFYELRTSPEVLAELNRQAEAIADASGPGYTAGEAKPGRKTSRVGVYTETYEAMQDNAKNQTLQKNLEAGRRG